MNAGGETERVDPLATINITPPQQNASPSTDDSKTPAINTKTAEPASAQPAPTKPKTTAKRKPKRHRRRTS